MVADVTVCVQMLHKKYTVNKRVYIKMVQLEDVAVVNR